MKSSASLALLFGKWGVDMENSGYNPMRYSCDRQGCFNEMRRPKIEVFAECFPGRIAMGDVDGIVEINCRGLLLEWKSDSAPLKGGQRIMYSRLTANCALSVIVVHGDAKTMEVSNYAWFAEGRMHDFIPSDLDGVKRAIRKWVEWAQKEPIPRAA